MLVYSDKLESEVNIKIADFGTSRYFSFKSISSNDSKFFTDYPNSQNTGVTTGLGTAQYTGISFRFLVFLIQ